MAFLIVPGLIFVNDAWSTIMFWMHAFYLLTLEAYWFCENRHGIVDPSADCACSHWLAIVNKFRISIHKVVLYRESPI